MSPAILRQSTTSPKIVCSPSFGKEASIVEKCWQKSLCLVSFVWGVRAVSHSCREIEQPKYLYYLLLLLKISKYLQYFLFFWQKRPKKFQIFETIMEIDKQQQCLYNLLLLKISEYYQYFPNAEQMPDSLMFEILLQCQDGLMRMKTMIDDEGRKL